VGVCQLLGEMMIEKGDKDKACDYFSRGLKLASDEVITQVQTMTEANAV
jgi:HemY protein